MNDFNPSSFLFPMVRLSTIPTATVEDVMEKLALIYSKGDDAQLASGRHGKVRVRGSLAHLDTSLRASLRGKGVNRKQDAAVDSGYASAEEDENVGEHEDLVFADTLRSLRDDSSEREYTIRWLTGFVSRASAWTFPNDQALLDEEMEEWEALVEKAASLLSSCASVNEDDDEALTRNFTFPLGPVDAGNAIHVELNDLQATEDHSSVGLQSWASSIHFARLMSENPAGFGIVPDRSRRILELGAGTGMLSIAAAKILRALSEPDDSALPEIVATDYHPVVLANLRRNIETNFTPDARPPVDVHSLDWQYPSWEHPFDAPFDLILAADVVYEPDHAGWIGNCVRRLLKKPSLSCPKGGVFWMIIALRNIGRHEGLAAAVFDIFTTPDMQSDMPTGELCLKTVQVHNLDRSEGLGRRDEAGYRLLKVCWV